MKHLLFLFISILISFCSINPANAESQIFVNPKCSDIQECNKRHYRNYSLWFNINQSNKQKEDNLNIFCAKAMNNPLAIATENTIWENQIKDIFFLFNSSSPTYGLSHLDFNYFYTSITCEVPKPKILGCNNPEATNYNPQATEDDGTCIIPPPPPPKIPGCTNPNALNYNPDATEENGTCQEKIEWCTDQTAINYNPQANVHKESMCEYTPPYTPQDITGAFQKSQVSIGATTWTIRVNLNVPNPNLDPSVIQTWNRFKAVSATTNEKTLEIVMRQFDDQRLEIEECTSYELTIPRNALYTTEWDTNANPISWNFEVVWCDHSGLPINGSGSLNVNIGSGSLDVTPKPKHENTIKEDNFYLSLYDTDENGKVYLNLTNIIYFVWFLSFFSVLFFVLFWFIKNSFLWKSKKSSR